jgi:pyridoxamine 5'-phosphate oxidase
VSAREHVQESPREPLALLDRWLADAREARLAEAQSVAFVTVGDDARPTARTVSLKRLERDALVFTSALWTRKARELERNRHVALLFHWPTLGRQVHVAGDAALAERALAEQLFAERDVSHQLQSRSTTCSRCAHATRTCSERWRRRSSARRTGAPSASRRRRSSSGRRRPTACTTDCSTSAMTTPGS